MSSVLNNPIFNSAYLPNVDMPAIESPVCQVADELCDELMLHTFECDDCLASKEETCPVFCGLRQQIAKAGGPTKGAALSM